MRELEAEIAEASTAAAEQHKRPIIVSTATQATSFFASNVRYVESLKRERIVHLVEGEPIHLSASLEQMRASYQKSSLSTATGPSWSIWNASAR